jgi:plastocyanin
LHLGWPASLDPSTVGYDVLQGTSVLGRTPATGFDVSGLVCATPYTFGVKSVDANGLSSSAAVVFVTTAACPPSSPPPPAAGAVLDLRTNGGIGFNSGTLSAPAGSVTIRLTNDSPFEHNIALSGNGVSLSGAFVKQGSVSSVTATLAPGTYTYFCEVGGHQKSGMTGTLTVTAATPPPIDTSLAAPTSLAASSISATGLTLAWTASSDPRVVSYRIVRGTTELGATAATSFSVAGLSCATSYAFAVHGVDVSGNVSPAATVSATTGACDGATLNLSVTATHTFSTTALTAPRGRVTIVLHNQSTLPHALRIAGHGVDVSFPTAQPGQTVSVTYTFTKADDYEFSCSLDGHSSERGKLYVT